MRIIVAETAGFCWGVQRAIDTSLSVAKSSLAAVYTYGPLIHNHQVVEELKKKNISTLEGDLTSARDGTIVVRAHGVRPEEMEQLKSKHGRVVDATCPLVTKVHRKIVKYQLEGYRIFIMGDRNHPEVEGLLGSAEDRAVVIPPDPLAVKDIPETEDRICLVSQTTQNDAVFLKVAHELQKKCSELLVVNTICEPTRSHQMETIDIASRCDTVVVVGGRHSANTKHLAELAAALGPRVIHVETDGELELTQFVDAKVVGVTAGASTPQWMIQRVVDRLESFSGRTGLFKRVVKKIIGALVTTNIYTTLGFASLYLCLSMLLEIPLELPFAIASTGVIFGLHCINEFSENTGFDRRSRLSPLVYERFRMTMLYLATLAIVVSLLLFIYAYILKQVHGIVLFGMMVAVIGGVVYGWKLIPIRYIERLGFRSIKDIPGSRDLSISLGWTMILAMLPFSGEFAIPYPVYLLSMILFFILIYRRTAILGVRDVQGDRIIGMESSFKFFGKKRARRLHRLMDVLSVILAVPLLFLSGMPLLKLVHYDLIATLAIGLFASFLYRIRRLPAGTVGQMFIDSQFVIPALAVVVIKIFFGVSRWSLF